MRCPVCNTENPDAAKFCNNCGNRMPERKTTGTSERKVVTVLFCDVKGSTALAEKLDPEEWTEIIDGAFRVLTPPIQRYGGTVARLLGDAVLAFFGAPVAHEDDPERALRAGLEMLHATGAYRERLVRERGAAFEGFDIRIGINTGLAVVGDVGAGQAVEYTGMGDAVNVAARLQTHAEPGTMLVSEQTLKWVPPIFDWEPVGELDVKGREAKLHAFRVRGVGAASTRLRPRGVVTPLVGRGTELASLRDALGEIRRGGGRIVSIVADAGLGKTRLIDELRKEWEASPVEGQRWTEARGQSYEQTRSYGLFRQHLLSLSGASEGDAPDVIRSRVVAMLPEERRGDERTLRTLDAFLAVDTGDADMPEREELRAEVHRLIRDLTRALATCQVAFVFDDLQWSDPASADLLAELFDLAEESPVLFILAFRPDRQAPSWRIKQKLETDFPHRYEELTLPPLSTEESAELLAHVLPGDGLPQRLRDRVLDKAEGNPFFLEEIVRALIDDGTIARDAATWRTTRPDADIELPGSLQAVLAARIDRLEADSRETLQAAAVIGRSFLYRVLAAIREASDRLDAQLRVLQRLELVQERSREPEREYTFRHALTQEAAYRSILQRKRRELHLRVGEALEKLFPDRTDELAPLLGHHYAEAADPRAVRHLQAAGDQAFRLDDRDAAAMHYRRALALVRRDVEDARVVTHLHLRYGRTLELRGEYAEALELYREYERLAREREDPAMEGAALSAQIVIHTNPTPFLDPDRANELADRTIELARARGDKPLLAKLLWNKAQAGFWRGAADIGLAAGLESASIARAIGDKEQLGFTLNTIGQIHRELGKLDDADEVLRESIALFAETGNRPMEADSWSTLAFIQMYRADFPAALDAGARAYRISDEIGNEWGRSYALFTPSYVHCELGEWGKAIAAYEECIAWGRKAGFYAAQTATGADLGLLYALSGDLDRAVTHLEAVVELAKAKFADWRAWPIAQLARVRILRGELEIAERLLDEATAADRTRGNLYMSIMIMLGRAELALARGDAAAAAAIARAERHLATDRGLRPFEPDFDLLEGQGALGSGDLAGARHALERGIAASRATGSRRLLWRMLWTLAQVAERDGRAGDATELRAEARRVAEGIAASLRERGLEDAFRARPEVRGILSGTPV